MALRSLSGAILVLSGALAAAWMLCATPVFADEAAAAPGAAIKSGCEYDYPPFCIVEKGGRANGFSVELLRAALRAMDRDVTFRTGPWAEVKGLLERGEVDALPLVARTPERESTFDFTFPYLTLHGAIVVREGTTDIHSPNDLKGRRVAVMKGDIAEEFVRRFERDLALEVHTTPTFEDALGELSDGRYDAVVIQRLLALRLIQQAGITNLRIVGKPLDGFRHVICFGVKEGDRETLSLLNEGLALVMADGTFARLQTKWFAPLELPSDDRIVIGTELDYPPYSFLDEKGKAAGYNVDLTRAIAETMRLDVEVRIGPWGEIRQALESGEIDAIAGMYFSAERDKLLDFSPLYAIVHHAIFVRRDAPSIETEEDLRGKDIIVMRGDIMHDYVLENGLSDNPALVDSQADALRLLASGEHDCAIVAQLPGLYWVKELGLSNIVTVGPLLRPSESCFAVTEGNTALRHLLSEGLTALRETGAHRSIYDKWLGVLEPRGVSLRTVLKYIALGVVPLLLLLMLSVIWSHTLKRRVASRTEALRESEEKYRTLVETMTDGLVALDMDLNINYVNDAFCRMVERSTDDLLGSPVKSLMDEAGRGIFDDEARKRREGKAEPYEITFLRRDGKPVSTTVSPRALVNEAGEMSGSFGVITDITGLKQAENALRESEEQFRTLAAASPIGVYQTDAEGNCVYTNEKWREMAGLSEEEALGQGWVRGIHPEDRDKVRKSWQRMVESEGAWGFEYRFQNPEGRTTWVSAQAVPLRDAHGEIVGYIGANADITDRKLAEEALKRIFDLCPDMICTAGADGFFKSLNPAWESVLGFTIEELLAKPFRDFLHPDDIEATVDTLAEQSAGKSILSFENRYRCKDGSYRMLEWRGTQATQGVVYAVARDVTERRQAESERETTIELLRLLNAKNDFHGLMRSTLRFMQQLSGCEALGIRLREGDDFPYYATSGFSDEFVEVERSLCARDLKGQLQRDDVGDPVLECMCGNIICGRFDPTKPFFTDHGSFMSNCTSELLASTTEEDRQSRTRNRCNAAGYESVFLVPLRAGGETFGLMQFNDRRKECFSDRFIALAERLADSVAIALAQRQAEEALRESEERLQGILTHSPSVIFLKDLEGRYLLVNRRYEELFHVTDAEIRGKTDHDVFPKDVADAFQEHDSKVAASGTPMVMDELVPQDDGIHHYLSLKYPVRNEEMEIVAVCGIATDVTERRKWEEQQESLIRELEAKNAELENFTYTVSHDLKSPLISISGFLGHLKKDAVSGDIERIDADVRFITEAVKRMDGLLTDLLELSRIGRMVNPPEDISLTALAQRGAEMLSSQISQQGVRVNIPTDMPVVRVDASRFTQVFENLIENAMKYMGEEPEPRIEIGVRRDDGEQVVFVKDNGAGIEPRYHERVFGLFNQLNPDAEGTGVGLALTKRIVEAHGGRVWVESEGAGLGSTFCFTVSEAKPANDGLQ